MAVYNQGAFTSLFLFSFLFPFSLKFGFLRCIHDGLRGEGVLRRSSQS